MVLKMKTQDLIELYRKFHKNPINKDDLINAIFNYSFDDLDRIIYSDEFEFTFPLKIDSFLKSNTGLKYKFYPMDVIEKIEHHLRHQFPYKQKLFVRDDLFVRKIYSDNNCVVGNDCHSPDFRNEIIKKIKEKTYIYGYANTLNQLSNDEELLINCSSKISGFYNTDVPCFVNTEKLIKHDIHLNDQMIDWKSGINFYTCIFGQKHFLPIFNIRNKKYKNLLNCSDFVSSQDDFIKIDTKRIKCDCGIFRCNFKFVPHYKNFIDGFDYEEILNLRNKLISKTRWIQFIQVQKKIHVFYETNQQEKLKKEDIDLIDEIFNKPRYIKGKYFKIGFKIPCFWKADLIKFV